MDTLYIACAVLGGVIWIGQFLLGLVGFGTDGDGDGGDVADVSDGGDAGHDLVGHGDDATGHHDSAVHWFLGLLTLRTATAALLFFGLSGWAANRENWPVWQSLATAVAGGLAAMLLVALVMKAIQGLSEEGTVQLAGAIGQVGTVYLGVPAHNTGMGKVTLNLQNRTVELSAISSGPELPTGAKVVVVKVLKNDVVEVLPARI